METFSELEIKTMDIKTCQSFYLSNTHRNHYLFHPIKELCRKVTRLWNQMLWYINNWYDCYESVLSYFDLNSLLSKRTTQNWYKAIGLSHIADITLKHFYGSVQSFIKLRSMKRKGQYTKIVRFPKYYHNNELKNSFCFRRQKIKNGFLCLGAKGLKIPVPLPDQEVKFGTIQLCNKDRIKISIQVLKPVESNVLDITKYVSLDLGVNNFAAIYSNDPTLQPILLNGKIIKSINHLYNKTMAKYSTKKRSERNEVDTEENVQKYLPYIKKVALKRNLRINHIIHVYSKFIVEYCKKYHIGNIIIGANLGWKQEVNLGSRTNQNFVQIPFYKFRQLVKYKAEIAGITYIETEESYTSKTDHLANELMEHKESYLGKRTNRGLFVSSTGKYLNADLNGAIGIMRKIIENINITDRIYKPLRFCHETCLSFLDLPLKTRVVKHKDLNIC